jgi:hypothetical protein
MPSKLVAEKASCCTSKPVAETLNDQAMRKTLAIK